LQVVTLVQEKSLDSMTSSSKSSLKHCFQQWQKHGTCCLTSEGVDFEGITETCNKYKHVFNNWFGPGSIGYSFVNGITLRP